MKSIKIKKGLKIGNFLSYYNIHITKDIVVITNHPLYYINNNFNLEFNGIHAGIRKVKW